MDRQLNTRTDLLLDSCCEALQCYALLLFRSSLRVGWDPHSSSSAGHSQFYRCPVAVRERTDCTVQE